MIRYFIHKKIPKILKSMAESYVIKRLFYIDTVVNQLYCGIKSTLQVKIGSFLLTPYVKMGYNKSMARDFILLFLRISLIATCWIFVWQFIKPRTQLMRILRAALLVIVLLVILVAIRTTGQ